MVKEPEPPDEYLFTDVNSGGLRHFSAMTVEYNEGSRI